MSFFPQLLVGPIERARNMPPQFSSPWVFDQAMAYDGVRADAGAVQKVAIADNCAAIVNPIFADHGAYEGGTLMLALVLFAFRIYCDFSGYSDIAIGCARLLGFQPHAQLRLSLFQQDIAEFAPLAHQPQHVVPRLPVHPVGWKPTWPRADRTQRDDHLRGQRLRMGPTDLHCVGCRQRILPIMLLLRDKHHTMKGTVAEGRMFPH